MSVCLLRIADGRDAYHDACWESASQMLPPFEHIVTIDDREHKLGFAGAIAEGWRQVLRTGADWIFALEMDFTFVEPVPLDRMIAVLERKPYLAQMSLLRQPCNDRERAAGGIIQTSPGDFEQVTDTGDVWVEQRVYWTTNPSVYSTGFCAQGWPQVERSEGAFTARLLEDPAVKFGIWGAKWDAPRIEHIGADRTGKGY